MTNLLIGTYNNYFNRIVKQEATDFSYFTVMSNTVTIKNINFNPNDGIFTKVILGKGDYTLPEDLNRPIQPDYAVLFNTELTEPPYADMKIISRWFIVEAVRTRSGQYELTLKRDVIVDNYNNVISAPVYIEKGYINDTKNPLLYNSEGLKVNQIKRYEVPLKDETASGWVVGYIPKDSFADADPANRTVNSTAIFALGADITVSNITQWTYWDYCNKNAQYKTIAPTNARKETFFKIKSRYQHQNKIYLSSIAVRSYVGRDQGWGQGSSWGEPSSINAYNPVYPSWWTETSDLMWSDIGSYDGGTGFNITNRQIATANLFNTYNGVSLNSLANAYLESKYAVRFNDSVYNSVRDLDNKIIYDQANNLYYRIKIKNEIRATYKDAYSTVTTTTTPGRNYIKFFNDHMVKTGFPSGQLTGSLSSEQVFVYMSESMYYIDLEQVAINVKTVIPQASSRVHLEDAPYDMFCIPYSDTLKLNDGADSFTCSKAVALSLATDIGAKSGSANVYDVQLLPYCPFRPIINMSPNPQTEIDISAASFSLIQSTEETPRKISAIIWCPSSSFSFEIEDLQNIQNCSFDEPYKDITTSTFIKDKYYVVDDLPTDYTNRMAFTTTDKNAIQVFELDKTTGKAVELGDFNTIEAIVTNDQEHYLNIYRYGEHATPTVRIAIDDYNASSIRYLFKLNTGSYGSQNISTFMLYIKEPILEYYDVRLSTPEDVKVTSECYLYRLSAGNHSAIFEFNPAKSFGYHGYLVDCTYKPFQPWIHIIPKLGGLYGDDFVSIDDARGLICGGDYSLTQLSNVWANYKLTNKTYQETCERDIAHMDVENGIARQEQLAKSITGAVTGTVTGAMAGGLAGGPWGAVAGGIVGAAGGIAGGVMDYQNMLTRQEENRDYAVDKFNYSLQNMQAIPSALSKTSSIVVNTRVWPFLEVYSCTDAEIETFRNKLKYDGMTVMAIGSIGDYLTEEKHYFKGKVIRLDSLDDDSHTANEIYNEISKGVYL